MQSIYKPNLLNEHATICLCPFLSVWRAISLPLKKQKNKNKKNPKNKTTNKPKRTMKTKQKTPQLSKMNHINPNPGGGGVAYLL